MSIEQTLERIAVGIEKLIELQKGTTAVSAPAAAPMPGPSGIGPGQTLPGPVPGTMPPPPNPAIPPLPGQAPAPAAPAPAAPAPAPAADTGLLDQIRDAANAFHRAHPERAGEVWQILSAVGVQKIDAIPPQSQQQVLRQIQALGA